MRRFIGVIEEKRDFINKSMESLDLSNIHDLLKMPTSYAISTGGKRLRPLICTLCAEAVGGDYKETENAFLAIESLHNGTLVHDDIIDEDVYRRSNLSVPTKYGQKTAVLTGDALLSLGLRFAAKTGNLKVVEWLSETALKMVQGVALQTFFRRKIISEDTYLNINYLKSGSLFEAAAAIGGLVGSNDEKVVERFSVFGRYFGDAYQIRDDIGGIYAEDRNDELARSDLENGDITLPMIYALSSKTISNKDRDMIQSSYEGSGENIDLEEVQRIYSETGAITKSIELMKSLAEKGRMSLIDLPKSEAADCINFLLDYYYRDFSPIVKLEPLV